MFLPNWSVKFEALYYDLVRATFYQNFVQTLRSASGAPGLGNLEYQHADELP